MTTGNASQITSATESPMAAAVRVVESFLAASMVPDPVRARTYLAPDVKITFTGGRAFTTAAEIAAFNATRYRKVSKQFERTEAIAGAAPDECTVYNSGTLYGEWPDGEAFSGNRYIDRFTVRGGKIVRMEVWNDSAERLLLRAGLLTV
ncbi:MAG: nuclear transport factor 2 family protein [Pseudomonadota bacterium]|nr:nuclear transport factor 2 family protein [Pseudomonadota bacterium]